jgi:hypothetical protein
VAFEPPIISHDPESFAIAVENPNETVFDEVAFYSSETEFGDFEAQAAYGPYGPYNGSWLITGLWYKATFTFGASITGASNTIQMIEE